MLISSQTASDKKRLKSLRITAIGGGHGLGRVMSTLSFLQSRLVGIVCTTDNGGATGMLRKHHQCIAWGDIRNCMSQLADQPLAKEVLNFRFNSNSNLDGHNLGNLLLYTLDALSARPIDGIQLLSRLLKVNNRILPMSETPTDLLAELDNNLQCFGEIRIDELSNMPKRLSLSPRVNATPEALHHLERSDLIILGPGSFLTSVMPPLLVDDMASIIAKSAAKVIFIDNLVPEQSPAGALSLKTKLEWLEQQLGYQLVDLAISNVSPLHSDIPVISCVEPDQELLHRHDTDGLLAALVQAAHHLIPDQGAELVTDIHSFK
ncbi:hypothetical protein CWE08_04620 [Aliidiomarina iranensis]|uniref:Putative gluconeogenesis factor n=1 Tax=Aliidiomarina iranensis TaxID=1434071 RepID=A0A432W0C1_9GAMM|nr:uridine diphosphate-N-acetylglucosamine-binding protein YvcK [Aliidiomarina iranensis]RUO22465.1 hypothetical protein CWE08_04620 [Aliidiomarina iranensis]